MTYPRTPVLHPAVILDMDETLGGGPLVTVVVATYNQARWVTDAVESVLAQTYPHIEIVLVDNGSEDETPSVLEPFLKRPGVVLQRYDRNGPITKRLNTAVRASKGDFISFLYGDDTYLPHKIERQIFAFAQLGPEYGVVYSPGYRRNLITGQQWLDPSIDASGAVLEKLLEGRGAGRFINPVSPLVRRECLEMHPFYEDIFVEGEFHYLRVATTHRFAFLAEPLVVMGEHEQNMGKAITRNLPNIDEMLKRLVRLPSFPIHNRRLIRRCRAQLYRQGGWIALRLGGDRRWAKACFRTAVKLEWRQALHPRTIVGYAVSVLPGRAARFVNNLGYRLHPSRENTVLKENY